MLWEILIPTSKPASFPGKKRWFSKKYHQQWDAKVIAISSGMTILHPTKGQWVSPNGITFKERMIPVRIACTKEQIERIVDLTAAFYRQEAVMAYKISDDVIIKHYK